MKEPKAPLRAVLGIDAAWTATEPSGVALAVETDGGWRLAAVEAGYDHFLERADGADPGLGRPRGASAEAAKLVAAVSRLVGRAPDCVAIDMPVGPNPIVGRRACDDAISRLYGARKAAVHSPGALRPGPISDALSAGFAALGFPVCVAPPASGLIEVYPHAALIEFMGEPERLPYKAAKTSHLLAGPDGRRAPSKTARSLGADRRGAGRPHRRRRVGAARSRSRRARLAAQGLRGQARRGRLRRRGDRRAERRGRRPRRRRGRDLGSACEGQMTSGRAENSRPAASRRPSPDSPSRDGRPEGRPTGRGASPFPPRGEGGA